MSYDPQHLGVLSKLSGGLAVMLDVDGRPLVGVNGVPMPMSTFVYILLGEMKALEILPAKELYEAEHARHLTRVWRGIKLPTQISTLARFDPIGSARAMTRDWMMRFRRDPNPALALCQCLRDLDEQYAEAVEGRTAEAILWAGLQGGQVSLEVSHVPLSMSDLIPEALQDRAESRDLDPQ